MRNRQLQRRLLHQDLSHHSTSQNKGVVPEKEELQFLSMDDVAREQRNCASNERELKTTSEESKNESYTTITTEPGTIALRTIPVYKW